MEENILEHYRKTSTYTYAGAYGEYFRSLPDDIPMLGRLVCGQVIHRVTPEGGQHQCQCHTALRRYGQIPLVQDALRG